MTASKIFLYFCLFFIFGIFLSSFFFISLPVLLAILILGLILISVLWRYKTIAVIGFSILFLIFGIWRHQIAEIQISKSKLQIYNNREEIITLIGIISNEPEIREKSQRLTLRVKEIRNHITLDNSITEKVLVITSRYPEYQYGDKLKITGKLKMPEEDRDGFNYKNYLKKERIYSVMAFPEIEVIDKNLGNPLMNLLFSFKNKFQEKAGHFLSPPQIGILEALFSGSERNLSKEWKDKLNFTGTRHITAVSGMNITIIAFLIFSFVLGLGLWRQQAFYLTIFLLLLYILMIGAPPSAVRAGIMAGILMTAQYLGRLSTASRAVVFAATVMLVQNPFLLALDVGFQLSFLAILGIIYLQPIFFDKLRKIPDFKIFPARTTLSATFAAQIFTLPILVYNFGYIPLVSPMTNILIVPFLAPITILIFLFGFLTMIFWPLGYLLSWPTWFCLTYIVSIVDWFSKLPFTHLIVKNLHWIWLIISYLILIFLTWQLREKEKLKFLNY